MKWLFAITCFMLLNCSFSQTAFEGVIKYRTEIKGKNPVMEGMMPDSFIFLFKNKDVRLMVSGGILSAMMGDIISKGDSNVSYMLDYTNKIAYRYDPYKYSKPALLDIDETDKTEKILNHKCKLYKISSSSKDGNIETDLWTTDQLDLKIPANNPLSMNFVFYGVEGFPLFIESKIFYQSTEFDVVIKAVKIIERPIPDDEFEIPQNFQVLPLLSTSDLGN